MFRLLLAAFGLAELAFPKPVVEYLTRLAYESPEEFEIKPWVVTAARVEGLVLLALAVRGCRCGSDDAE